MAKSTVKNFLIGEKWRKTLVRTVLVAIVTILICKFLYLPYFTAGKSMEPTVMDNRLIFIDRLAYNSEKPQRGDVVAIRMAGQSVTLLKRIVALPNEALSIKNGVLHINGELLDEPYLLEKGSWNLKDQHLSEGQYFVIGDNRSVPMALHKFGKVSKHRIIGRKL